jgi:predicted nucleotidyltransferase component of viral defense system
MRTDYLETVQLLLEVAPFVFHEQSPFAMKGGTAINLFCQQMPRLSVDIDLVLTEHYGDRDSALARIESALDVISENLRTRLRVEVQRRISGSSYETKMFIVRSGVGVKVEVNHVFRGSVYPIVSQTLSKAAEEKFSRSITVRILDRDELYASKLVAALDRQHPRDLFDVMLLFRDGGITPRIRRAFTVYLAGHNRPIHELLPPQPSPLESTFENQFVGMTTEEVKLEELEATRARLFEELPAALDADECAFLLSLKKLEPKWDLLGVDGLEEMPSIKWKLLNLKKLSTEQPKKYSNYVSLLDKRLKC